MELGRSIIQTLDFRSVALHLTRSQKKDNTARREVCTCVGGREAAFMCYRM